MLFFHWCKLNGKYDFDLFITITATNCTASRLYTFEVEKIISQK